MQLETKLKNNDNQASQQLLIQQQLTNLQADFDSEKKEIILQLSEVALLIDSNKTNWSIELNALIEEMKQALGQSNQNTQQLQKDVQSGKQAIQALEKQLQESKSAMQSIEQNNSRLQEEQKSTKSLLADEEKKVAALRQDMEQKIGALRQEVEQKSKQLVQQVDAFSEMLIKFKLPKPKEADITLYIKVVEPELKTKLKYFNTITYLQDWLTSYLSNKPVQAPNGNLEYEEPILHTVNSVLSKNVQLATDNNAMMEKIKNMQLSQATLMNESSESEKIKQRGTKLQYFTCRN